MVEQLIWLAKLSVLTFVKICTAAPLAVTALSQSLAHLFVCLCADCCCSAVAANVASEELEGAAATGGVARAFRHFES